MLSQTEQKAYYDIIEDIIKSKDLVLLDWLIGALLFARAQQRRELTPVQFKICDKCNRTFSYYTLNCTRCNSDKLRDFTIRHNHEKILDG